MYFLCPYPSGRYYDTTKIRRITSYFCLLYNGMIFAILPNRKNVPKNLMVSYPTYQRFFFSQSRPTTRLLDFLTIFLFRRRTLSSWPARRATASTPKKTASIVFSPPVRRALQRLPTAVCHRRLAFAVALRLKLWRIRLSELSPSFVLHEDSC